MGTRGYRNPETWELRESMRALFGESRRGQISDRYPHRATDVFDALTSDWGEVTDRRLWRVLWWLLSRGFVVRVGTSHNGSSYVRGYAPETPWDYGERYLAIRKGHGVCRDCQTPLDPERPFWHWQRCPACVAVEKRAVRKRWLEKHGWNDQRRAA